MEGKEIFQAIVAIIGVMAGLSGVLGKRHAVEMLHTVIHAIEDTDHKETKAQVRKRSLMDRNHADIDREIFKATKSPVKRIRGTPC